MIPARRQLSVLERATSPKLMTSRACRASSDIAARPNFHADLCDRDVMIDYLCPDLTDGGRLVQLKLTVCFSTLGADPLQSCCLLKSLVRQGVHLVQRDVLDLMWEDPDPPRALGVIEG